MEDSRKITAAASAVMSYIKTEEEALALSLAAAAPEAGARPPAPEAPARAWSAGGRQAHMQVRSMMQMKAFHGWRPR